MDVLCFLLLSIQRCWIKQELGNILERNESIRQLSGAREAVEMSHFPVLWIFCCCLCILAVQMHDAAVPVSVRVGSWSPLQRQRFFPPGLISVRRVHSARGIRRGCENGNETFTKTEHLSIPYLHHIVLAAKTQPPQPRNPLRRRQNPRPLPQIPKISVPQPLGLSLRVNTVI